MTFTQPLVSIQKRLQKNCNKLSNKKVSIILYAMKKKFDSE